MSFLSIAPGMTMRRQRVAPLRGSLADQSACSTLTIEDLKSFSTAADSVPPPNAFSRLWLSATQLPRHPCLRPRTKPRAPHLASKRPSVPLTTR